MILRLFALLLLALPLRAAQTIVFANGSFEAQALGEGGFTSADTTSWTANASAGAFNPDSPLNFAPDGQNVLFFNPAGTVSQDLKTAGNVAVTAQAGATLNVNFFGRAQTTGGSALQFTR